MFALDTSIACSRVNIPVICDPNDFEDLGIALDDGFLRDEAGERQAAR